MVRIRIAFLLIFMERSRVYMASLKFGNTLSIMWISYAPEYF